MQQRNFIAARLRLITEILVIICVGLSAPACASIAMTPTATPTMTSSPMLTQTNTPTSTAIATIAPAATATLTRTRNPSTETSVPPTGTSLPGTETPGSSLPFPSGTPQSEWDGIPIMPQAIAGMGDEKGYQFSTKATFSEVQDYYLGEMTKRGWTFLGAGNPDTGLVLLFLNNGQSVEISFVPQGEVNMVSFSHP